MKFFVVLSLVAVLVPAAASAQHQTFTVNPDASEVKIKLNTTHEVVNGIFHVQSGAIDFDRTASRISGLVVVTAGSGKTGNDSRDRKMTKDILKVDQFAAVMFEPKAFAGTLDAKGDSIIQVSGVFTLLGTPHDITIPMQIHMDAGKATAAAQFIVPYVQWGLRNPSFLIFRAESNVAVSISLKGQITN